MNTEMNTGIPEREKAKRIHRMFASIAKRYDFLNTVLSLNRDRYWRTFTAERSGLSGGGLALDVATGTGKLAAELARKAGPDGTVIGVDFCKEMLDIGRADGGARTRPPHIPVKCMAENLPFSDNTFDCATIGFALRNVTDIRKTLKEMARVVKKGGRVISLEFSHPKNRVFRRVYYFYFSRILPVLGGIVSRRDAYSYLPWSVVNFVSREQLKEMMEEAGLNDIEIYDLTGGIVAVHIGIKRIDHDRAE